MGSIPQDDAVRGAAGTWRSVREPHLTILDTGGVGSSAKVSIKSAVSFVESLEAPFTDRVGHVKR